MKTRTSRKGPLLLSILVVVALLSAFVLASGVFADPNPSYDSACDDVATCWMLRAQGIEAERVLTPGESEALETASEAIVAPPEILIRNADHGYDACVEKLESMRELTDTEPVLMGHELVLYNDTNTARIFVSEGGVVRLIDSGGPEIMPATLHGLSGPGEFAAAEIARNAICLQSQLNPDSPYCDMNSMLTGYGVGFADGDDNHVIVRVGADDSVSCPEW